MKKRDYYEVLGLTRSAGDDNGISFGAVDRTFGKTLRLYGPPGLIENDSGGSSSSRGRNMRRGPIPVPVAAHDATGFDDVTNGYVPWSRSRNVAWAPSSRR